ncbi:MAG TPA: ATP-dependent Clp protease ATP-binding subunit ClpX, partial [Bacteroidota bacterium]|nr:ATP-dependent Clp protease ATP-binding subunit ClpX [Bacteroidota bacterium]
NPMGFGANIRGKKEFTVDEYLPLVEPDDLLKFGLIPEFIGRLPVVATLHSLDEPALHNILTAPKNAIVKQYKKLFSYEGVELEFEPDALKVVVSKAMERRTGARALRSIMEEMMLEIMYNLPGRQNIAKCTITKDVILKKKEPLYSMKERKSA